MNKEILKNSTNKSHVIIFKFDKLVKKSEPLKLGEGGKRKATCPWARVSERTRKYTFYSISNIFRIINWIFFINIFSKFSLDLIENFIFVAWLILVFHDSMSYEYCGMDRLIFFNYWIKINLRREISTWGTLYIWQILLFDF